MRTNPVRYDFDAACLEPKTLCSWLDIKGNYLGHEEAVTIGHPTQPPKKRGQGAGRSLKDGLLIAFGRTLISMGITPQRVRVCVDAVRKKWHLIEPDDIDLDSDLLQSQPPDYFLLAGEEQTGFKADLIPQDKVLLAAGAMPGGAQSLRPRLFLNMSLFALWMTQSLLRHMRGKGKELPMKKRGKKLPVKA